MTDINRIISRAWKAQNRYERRRFQLIQARLERREAFRAALDAKVTARDLAGLTGLSITQARQIARKAKVKVKV